MDTLRDCGLKFTKQRMATMKVHLHSKNFINVKSKGIGNIK